MAVIIDEMEGTVDPEPAMPSQQGGDAAQVSKELSLDKIRSEVSRLAQREMRLRAD
ncbi:MAG: hypothetical protein QOH63_2946 [Acidobacteriota bacterium]|jgi:hypothetical protein|nr:hypothetical protein [Acidobacteriota bacterium]